MTHPVRGKYGCLPTPKDHRCQRFAALAAAIPDLPPPPASVDWTGGRTDWGMMGNDRVGNCTIAEAGHLQMAWAAAAGQPIPQPPDDQILAAYSAVSGYDPQTGANDNGAACSDVLNYWQQTGIAGNKISGYAAVTPSNWDHVRQAVNLFGGVYAAFTVPSFAEYQFDHGQPWSQPWGWYSSVGGHAVPILAYSPAGLTCVTWGRLQQLTWDFFFRYFTDIYAVVDPLWFNQSQYGRSPVMLSIQQTLADLPAVAA